MSPQAERPPPAAAPASSASVPASVPAASVPAASVPAAAASDSASASDSESDDALDIFDSGLSSLFAVPPIGFSSTARRAHEYAPPAGSGLPPVAVWTASPPPAVFARLQAQHLWLAAVFLADRIATRTIPIGPRPGARGNPSVLELGAGAGLPSVVAGLRRKADAEAVAAAADRDGGAAGGTAGGTADAAAGAAAADTGVIVCTDYDDASVVANMRRNVAAAGAPVLVRGHSWGGPTDELRALAAPRAADGTPGTPGGGFDVLLLADTLWSTDTHGILLDSVLALLAPGGTAHLAAGLHTGRGPHERFASRAAARGLTVTKIEEVIYDAGGEWAPHTASAEGLEEERGVVIYYTMHR